MQISNKKHIKDIDERNSKLLKYKMSFANTQHELNKLKQDLAKALSNAENNKREMETRTQSYQKKLKDVDVTLVKIKHAEEDRQRQKGLKT